MMQIKNAISKLIFDMNIDPAEFRVIFKRQSGEYWDVPFNYLIFQGNYFSYNDTNTIYPLHRIVAIYNKQGTFLLKRKYDTNQITIKPDHIELIPGTRINTYLDTFKITRYAWLIIQHIQDLLRKNDKDDIINMLGDHTELNEIYCITSGYFAGTIIHKRKILRGTQPIDYNKISDKLQHQRIYVYAAPEISIIHKINKHYLLYKNKTLKHINSPPHQDLLTKYSLITHKQKILALIDKNTKMINKPQYKNNKKDPNQIKPQNITKKEWLWHKKNLLIISDYDNIMAKISS
ncbi:MAG: RNA repair domain-containing protein [Candidatus Njordarchaeota archaeon]